MSTSDLLLPSHFGIPFPTTISTIRYDSKGRQLGFIETEVQRLERLALINTSKSRSSSPILTHSASGSPSPSRAKLIAEPYADPIELMANRLAEEFFSLDSYDDLSSSSDEESSIIYSTPQSTQDVPSSRRPLIPRKVASSTFKPGHRRKSSSLSSIPEED
ncbi:hypothetical protein B0H34DRAFT_720335 [Crassisporium funariophilum]|nr:hypothetical protein B0H34DRAFT_720335 [Crassisporium funariophilum]